MCDLSRTKRYNINFLSKYVLSSVTEQINFCTKVGLILAKEEERSGTYCKCELHLVAENGQDHTAYDQVTNRWVTQQDAELSHETLQLETVIDWLTYFCEVQLEALIRHSTGKTGRANCTVEIDESKFSKSKYNCGCEVEGQ